MVEESINKVKQYYIRRTIWQRRIAVEGEAQAERYLVEHGYLLVAKNWRAGKYGEIDLIMLDPVGTLVFIEVKTRRTTTTTYGIDAIGFEAINFHKQRKIIASALFFRQTFGYICAARFDAVTVVYQLERIPANSVALPQPTIIHVPNAFTLHTR